MPKSEKHDERLAEAMEQLSEDINGLMEESSTTIVACSPSRTGAL
jgi:hypothetical protein